MTWISRTDGLPPRRKRVLFVGTNKAGEPFEPQIGEYHAHHGWYSENTGGWVEEDGLRVTHWMPLPDYPKEDDKEVGTIKIETPNNHFDAILVSAVRYCIGRRTYMPGLVTGWIMAQCNGKLEQKTIAVMLRDIDDAHGLGDKCDVDVWRRFREWLMDQEGNEK